MDTIRTQQQSHPLRTIRMCVSIVPFLLARSLARLPIDRLACLVLLFSPFFRDSSIEDYFSLIYTDWRLV